MKRTRMLMMGGAVALLVGMATAASSSESVAGEATVESAGSDGGRIVHTAQVESAEAPGSLELQPESGGVTRLALFALLGAGALGTALVLRQRRQRVPTES